MERMLEVGTVDDQARSLLQTVEQMTGQLRDFRAQRNHKSHLFTDAEHRLFDETDYYTEEAITQVASLVEGIRADADANGGKIRKRTRFMFAFKNSPKVQVALTQLGIAAQSLNRDLATIANKNWKNPPQPVIQVTEYYAPAPTPPVFDPTRVQEFYNPHLEPRDIKPPPPAYEEALFLAERRQRNHERRATASRASSSRPVSSLTHSADTSLQYRPSTENVMELPSDQGFGPMFDRSPHTPTGSIALSDELFLGPEQQAAPLDTLNHVDRQPRPHRAMSGPSTSSNLQQFIQQPYQPGLSGRQRSMRWLEDRTGDESFG